MSESVNRRPLLILTAVRLEAKAVAGGLGLRPCGERMWRGVWGRGAERDVMLQVIGIRAVGRLPELGAYGGVILAGLAGALAPELQVGDLVVDMHSRPLPPGGLWHAGVIHTATRVVATPAEKAELRAATGALAVDMENAKVRVEIDRVGIPFLHLRAISDTAAEGVDPAVLGLIDEYGDPKPAALAGTLVRRPNLLPTLMQLGRNSKLAAMRLASTVGEICAGGWPEV